MGAGGRATGGLHGHPTGGGLLRRPDDLTDERGGRQGYVHGGRYVLCLQVLRHAGQGHEAGGIPREPDR